MRKEPSKLCLAYKSRERHSMTTKQLQKQVAIERARLGQRELELLNYLHQQFPATIGHFPLEGKIHLVYQSGMEAAADIVRERARLLRLNNCKDTIREHYSEQAIRDAAWKTVVYCEQRARKAKTSKKGSET